MCDAVTRTAALDAAEPTCSAEGSDVGYTSVSNRGDFGLIDAELVAVSNPSGATTADMKALLGPNEHYILTKEDILLPKGTQPTEEDLRRVPVNLGVVRGQYLCLLYRMFKGGMMRYYSAESEAIENSLFGVWKEKGKSQRVIWVGLGLTCCSSHEARSVELPTPIVLADLRLPPGELLYLASSHISQFYNKLAVPEFLVPYLGLPRVRSSLVDTMLTSEFVIPCLLCIPMGANFAVSLAQAVSMAAVTAAGLGSHLLD